VFEGNNAKTQLCQVGIGSNAWVIYCIFNSDYTRNEALRMWICCIICKPSQQFS
jgi:hypothetical protein